MYFLSLFIHLLAAIFWLGGMLFMVLVLVPAIRNNPQRMMLFSAVGKKFRNAGWIALGLLLLTGIINLDYRGVPLSELSADTGTGLMGIKKLLVFGLIVLVSYIHDFKLGPKTIRRVEEGAPAVQVNKLRLLSRIMGFVNVLLALTAVILGMMIVRGNLFG